MRAIEKLRKEEQAHAARGLGLQSWWERYSTKALHILGHEDGLQSGWVSNFVLANDPVTGQQQFVFGCSRMGIDPFT